MGTGNSYLQTDSQEIEMETGRFSSPRRGMFWVENIKFQHTSKIWAWQCLKNTTSGAERERERIEGINVQEYTSGTMASRATKLSKVHKEQDRTGPADQTLHSKTHLDKSTDIRDGITNQIYCLCATDMKVYSRIIFQSRTMLYHRSCGGLFILSSHLKHHIFNISF